MRSSYKFLIFAFLFLVVVWGVFFILWQRRKLEAKTPGKESFKWGLTMKPWVTGAGGPLDPKLLAEELDLAQKLGVKWLRLHKEADEKANLTQITKGREKRFNLVIALEPVSKEKLFKDNPTRIYQEAKSDISPFAKQFAGEIGYYQLANEPGSTVLNGNADGTEEGHYDPQKYKNMLAWLKGSADGIKANDPSAKIVITEQWLHAAILDMLIRDGLNFDVIGWDWYLPNTDLTKISYGNNQTYNLLAKLQGYGKELWLAEANRKGGDWPNNEKDQADYLVKFARQTYQGKVFKGFFVHQLLDDAYGDKREENGSWGIVKVKKVGIFWQIDQPKRAYFELQSLLKSLK